VNIPLADLRGELPELVFNVRYIMCCDTGRRSDCAAFLLTNKGFDVFVLAGGLSALSDAGADGVALTGAAAQELPVAETSPQAGDGLQRVQDAYEQLHEQHAALQGELGQRLESEARLKAQLEQLRGELGESTGKLGELYSSIRGHDEEQALLLEQYNALQEEHSTVLGRLQTDLGSERGRADDLQEKLEQLQQEHHQLVEQVAAGEASAGDQLVALQHELGGAQDRIVQLESALQDAGADREQVQRQAESAAQEFEKRSGLLSGELASAHADVERLTGLLDSAVAENQGRGQALTGLEQELSGLREQFESLSDRLSTETASVSTLQERNEALESTVAGLRSDLDERQARLDQVAGSSDSAVTALNTQLSKLQEKLQAQAEEITALVGAREQTQADLAALQEDNTRLRAAQGETETHFTQQEQEYENLLAGHRRADEEFRQQQAGWESARAALEAQLEEQQQAGAALHAEIERMTVELEQVTSESGQRLQQQIDESQAALEQRESRIAELQEAAAGQQEELERAGQERDGLNEQLQQARQAQAALEQEVAAFKEQLSELTSSSAEQVAALQAQLEAGQKQHEQLCSEIADKDARLERAALQVSQYEVEKDVLGQELELVRQQHAELQKLATRHEERVQVVEQELRDAVHKSHEELKRKNDNEKELQGQIDRLRKKLEQVTADYRGARTDAQDGLDSLREELQSEREARAEERAQMAARQRELKEQLAAIATEHESKITNQSGVIEEAVAAVRAEEHRRLQGVLEAQATTEEQLARLQQELKQAHAELVEFQRQEKDRRQTDIDLMTEQNQQAEAAISQLQGQLRELTRERDSALEDQQTLREKMNVLRGEVEVARGLVNRSSQGVVEDPVQLRKQLEDTRKNVEVAVRLRSEAEMARDRLLEERDRLLVQVENMQGGAVHAPARRVAPARPVKAPAPPPASAATASPGVQQSATRSMRWLVLAVGLLAVLAIVAAGWSLLGSDRAVRNDVETAVAHGPVPETVAAHEPVPAVVPDPVQPVPPMVQEPVQSAAAALQPEQAAVPAVAPAPAKPVLGEFRDSLKSGGRGPLMVELAAASFRMGSPGNSINFEEVPRHQVSLDSFSISRYEVTFDEYDRFARANGRRLPYDETWGRGKQPVINVSWHDAQAYVRWLSAQTGKHYRLPSEAEWEYAMQAGNNGSFWWSDVLDTNPANCFNCGSQWDGARTAPVGQFSANGYGLYDMAGNVQEWVADCYHDSYRGAPVDGTAWTDPLCTQRSVRGGAYSSPLDSLRSTKRAQLDQDTRLDNLGFRVVRDN